MNKRHGVLLLFSGMTAVSVIWTAMHSDESNIAAAQSVRNHPTAARARPMLEPGKLSVQPLRPRVSIQSSISSNLDDEDEMFRPTSWASPASLVPPLPPALAEKPAGPFTYIGKMTTPAGWKVFLSKDGETFVVSAGDTILHDYKIESIALPNITITNKPLHLMQTLQID
ncbi:hypothetical protein [Caballeronia sordidicola]|uniref:Putative secretion system X translation initiation factor n=1 Tax=Caballeronia sordidicola TaxID=196367 RepID=A0A226WT39_CABSO|nr:hypothetical protein [Caballeronia sordidicola]OXC74354.1 putative secretion system X translation initiation factor [Caballeronia sordidicola]